MDSIKVTEPTILEDGIHTGMIEKVEDRTTPQGYEYIDVWIKTDEKDMMIKYGCPKASTMQSKLMKMVSYFKPDLKVGDDINVDIILTGRACRFMTQQKANKEGKKYTEVIEDSLKPQGEEVVQ
jgi:hypothetical protein